MGGSHPRYLYWAGEYPWLGRVNVSGNNIDNEYIDASGGPLGPKPLEEWGMEGQIDGIAVSRSHIYWANEKLMGHRPREPGRR
jgi:hypothetical protein